MRVYILQYIECGTSEEIIGLFATLELAKSAVQGDWEESLYGDNWTSYAPSDSVWVNSYWEITEHEVIG